MGKLVFLRGYDEAAAFFALATVVDQKSALHLILPEAPGQPVEALRRMWPVAISALPLRGRVPATFQHRLDSVAIDVCGCVLKKDDSYTKSSLEASASAIRQSV